MSEGARGNLVEERTMKSMVAALMLSAVVMVGCVDGEEGEVETEEVVQELAGCVMFRPFGWNQSGVNCMEDQAINTSIGLNEGQTYTAIAVPWGVLGTGYAKVKCTGGVLKVTAKSCRRAGAPE
jgi:hypothetical protein